MLISSCIILTGSTRTQLLSFKIRQYTFLKLHKFRRSADYEVLELINVRLGIQPILNDAVPFYFWLGGIQITNIFSPISKYIYCWHFQPAYILKSLGYWAGNKRDSLESINRSQKSDFFILSRAWHRSKAFLCIERGQFWKKPMSDRLFTRAYVRK